MVEVLLKIIARKSPERYKVGAIYRQGWRVSWGYNTSASYGQHAEDMALLRFIKWYNKVPKSGTMYCTYSPCTVCEKNVKERNINVRYVTKYTCKL